MVKVNLLVSIVIVMIITGCTENPAILQQNETHGFSLSAYFGNYDSDSSLIILINFDEILHDMPKISINGKVIDTGYYPNQFIHTIPNFKANGFTYKIEYDGDYISDSIIIPKAIDSVFCNGVFLRDTAGFEIDTASNYQFKWKKTQNSILYSVWIWTTESNDYRKITSDTSVLFSPNRKPSEYLSSSGTIEICGMSYPEMSRLSKPDKESDKLFIFYNQIQGPYKNINFLLHSTK